MSFDLGVWYSQVPLSDEEAAEIYVHLCGDWPYLGGEHHSVGSFYEELTKRWPEIDTVPDERIDDLEYCPWSCAISCSGMAVVTSCVWSMADKVESFIRELAKQHKLILFDPQSGKVHLPERP